MEKSITKITLLVMIVVVTMLMAAQIARAGSATIAGTKHNLTSSTIGGTKPGLFKANETTAELCVFCHTPHFSNNTQPLWNRSLATADFTLYKNVAGVDSGNPAGVSAACLSCHDGAVAFNTVLNKTGSGTTGSLAYTFPTGKDDMKLSGSAYISKDISDDHPISVVYGRRTSVTTSDLVGFNTKTVATAAGAKLYGLGDAQTVECASCHDVHSNTYEPFLRVANTGSALCLACHKK